MFTLVIVKVIYVGLIFIALINFCPAFKKTSTKEIIVISLMILGLGSLMGFGISNIVGHLIEAANMNYYSIDNSKELVANHEGKLIENVMIKDDNYISFSYKDKKDTIKVLWEYDEVKIINDKNPHLVITYTIAEFGKLPPRATFFTFYRPESRKEVLDSQYTLYLPEK